MHMITICNGAVSMRTTRTEPARSQALQFTYLALTTHYCHNTPTAHQCALHNLCKSMPKPSWTLFIFIMTPRIPLIHRDCLTTTNDDPTQGAIPISLKLHDSPALQCSIYYAHSMAQDSFTRESRFSRQYNNSASCRPLPSSCYQRNAA
jgi:hypothetical protein